MTATVERLEVEQVVSRIKPPVSFAPDEKKSSVVTFFNSVFPVFTAIAAVLAIRLFLLFAVVGAFVLAENSLIDQTYHSMWVLISYCAFTILPLVWLDTHGRKKD